MILQNSVYIMNNNTHARGVPQSQLLATSGLSNAPVSSQSLSLKCTKM